MDQSRHLRAEALEIVQQLGLLDILQHFGEARVVGSVALDLVVKPDIDLHLALDKNDLLAGAKEVAGALINKEEIKEIRIADYREKNSFFIGIDRFPGKTTAWSIDIWITSDPSMAGFELIEKLPQQLTPGQREAILHIKRYYHQQGLLQDGLSLVIYTGVIEHGVRGLDEFKAYRAEYFNKG